MRGNLLDLEHRWLVADSPDDPYLPIPPHLRLVRRPPIPIPIPKNISLKNLRSKAKATKGSLAKSKSLDLANTQNLMGGGANDKKNENEVWYWQGLTKRDLEAIKKFSKGVDRLLASQGVTRLDWSITNEYWQKATLENIMPAFSLLLVPSAGLKPRRPRYPNTHSHGATTIVAAHPPIKEQWPAGGRAGLRDFIVKALNAENIQAWSAPQFDLIYSLDSAANTGKEKDNLICPNYHHQAIAVVTAPWFYSLDSYDKGAIKHVAVTISKLDYYLFD